MKKETRSAQRGIRIIGGNLKRSKIKVIDHGKLRPTPDRVRETIFNWLIFSVPNADVIDCYAGSGALGLEALSRGARSCTFIENNQRVAESIQMNIDRFKLQASASVVVGDVFNSDRKLFETASLIFADPPFHNGMIQAFLTWIQDKVSPDCFLMVESASIEVPDLKGFKILKELKAGNDAVRLLKLIP